MKYTLLFLLSSWFSQVAPPHTPHMIMTNLLSREESSSAVVALQKKYHIPVDRSILLREEKNLPPFLEKSLIRQVTINQLLAARGEKDSIIPIFHVYSRFHHDYLYARYSTVVPYHDYCTAEEELAKMVVHLLHDPDPSLFIVQNEEWFFDESFQSFLTMDEKKEIDTTLMVDLDSHPNLEILPKTNHRIIFWDRVGRPIL